MKLRITNYELPIFAILMLAFLSLPVLAQKRGAKVSNTMNNSSNTVFLPNRSPLISLRVQFLIGAMDDPAGKEGVASLTAAMLAGGGSKTQTYEQIVE
ncbi:MAG TPA: hypothetical protein VEQ34_11040, partial [Pyrinomonadaceae bacterium]|nr:hypothetical protein [Pyrinomonadaceae bacterium]